MPARIRFSVSRATSDRIHYISEADIRTLLDRLPEQAYSRLRIVHLNHRNWGRRPLGYVEPARREISLCAMPPHVSLTSYLVASRRSPRIFGAARGKSWPRTAVRRFMLYDVFLHELGHLQVVDEAARSVRRKFAMERRAQEFADCWRKKLWGEEFHHPDPIHFPPTEEELREVENA